MDFLDSPFLNNQILSILTGKADRISVAPIFRNFVHTAINRLHTLGSSKMMNDLQITIAK